MFEKAGASGLNTLNTPCVAVWQLLTAGKQNARARGGKVVDYVDITAPDLYPMWLPKTAMQGKAVLNEVKADADNALVALGQSLLRQTQAKRTISSFPQWVALFMRCAVVAVGVEQVAWAWVSTT